MKTQKTIHEKNFQKIKSLMEKYQEKHLDVYQMFRENSETNNVSEIAYSSRDGFCSMINGGAVWSLKIPVNYLISTGFGYAKLSEEIDNFETKAYNEAVKHIGERTDENENEWLEVYDEWLEDLFLIFEINVALYEKDNYNNPFPEKESFICKTSVFLTSETRADLIFDTENELTNRNLGKSIVQAFKFISNG